MMAPCHSELIDALARAVECDPKRARVLFDGDAAEERAIGGTPHLNG